MKILWILIPVIIILFVLAPIIGLVIWLVVGDNQGGQSRTPHRRRFFMGRAERKGAIGEDQVEELLQSCMVAGDKLLSNVRLPDWEKGDIDHILLSSRGFFVIETKNWAGDIYGNDNDEIWRLVFPDGSQEERYSPYKQNSGHIYALKKFCKLHVWFENVIIFVQDNTQYIQSSCVFTPSKFQERLNSLNDVNIHKSEELDDIFHLLRPYASYVFDSSQLQVFTERN